MGVTLEQKECFFVWASSCKSIEVSARFSQDSPHSKMFNLSRRSLSVIQHTISSTIINHHQPIATIINHHQPSSTIINHHQPSSTIIATNILDVSSMGDQMRFQVYIWHRHYGSLLQAMRAWSWEWKGMKPTVPWKKYDKETETARGWKLCNNSCSFQSPFPLNPRFGVLQNEYWWL